MATAVTPCGRTVAGLIRQFQQQLTIRGSATPSISALDSLICNWY